MNYKVSYLLSNYSNSYITMKKAAQLTGLSPVEIKKQLNKLNVYLGTIQKTKQKQVFVPTVDPLSWSSLIVLDQVITPVYSENERKALIYLLCFSEFEELSVFHFQDFLAVSKGTVLADIKKLRDTLAHEQLSLEYSRKTGFFITGDEHRIRRKAQNYLAWLLQSTAGKIGLFHWLDQFDLTFYARLRDLIHSAAKEENLIVVPSRVDEIALFLGYMHRRMVNQPLKMVTKVTQRKSLTAYRVSRSITATLFTQLEQKITKTEQLYLTTVLMTVSQGEIQDIKLDFLLSCSSEIIHRMESLSAIQFSNFKELLMNLFYHLVPAYFRITEEFYLPNVLIDNIRDEYAEIFELTKEALLPLEKLVGHKIPEEEIGFFTILFGGEIANQKEEERQAEIRALIVCPSGISSSLILQSELKKMFPTIIFEEANSIDQMQNVPDENYDVVFSTISVDSMKKTYLVKPLMSQLEKNKLINQVQEELLIPGFSLPSVEEIMDALMPYVELKKGVSKEKVYKALNKKMNHYIEKKEEDRPMLTELLTPEMIQFATGEAMNWENAIKFAAKPLVDNNLVEPRYAEAMIDKVKQFGPFIHIGKGIALPHARPEDGVNKVGMSLLKVQKPILLLDDEKHPIQIFVCLAAIDNEAHLRALASLTRILSNSENLEALLGATTTEEILTILTKGEN